GRTVPRRGLGPRQPVPRRDHLRVRRTGHGTRDRGSGRVARPRRIRCAAAGSALVHRRAGLGALGALPPRRGGGPSRRAPRPRAYLAPRGPAYSRGVSTTEATAAPAPPEPVDPGRRGGLGREVLIVLGLSLRLSAGCSRPAPAHPPTPAAP